MEHTALIVPAWSTVAGQCRIVSRPGEIGRALADYRRDPSAWREVGIMSSRGELVCCEDLGNLRAELSACVPLMAGLTVYYEA